MNQARYVISILLSLSTLTVYSSDTFQETVNTGLQNPVSLIIHNPVNALKNAESVLTSFHEKTNPVMLNAFAHPENLKKMVEEVKRIEKEHLTTSPFFRITECLNNDRRRYCTLNRIRFPKRREQFEKAIIQLPLHTTADKTLQYVSFASGNGFLDVRILLGLIAQHNLKTVNIHLIDCLYVDSSLKRVKPEYLPTAQTPLDLPFLFENENLTKSSFIKALRSNYPLFKERNDDQVVHQGVVQLISSAQIYTQMKAIFAYLAPTTKVALSLHSSSKDYLSSSDCNPDYVIAADMQENFLSTLSETQSAWQKLCKEAGKKNRQAHCYSLDKTATGFSITPASLIPSKL